MEKIVVHETHATKPALPTTADVWDKVLVALILLGIGAMLYGAFPHSASPLLKFALKKGWPWSVTYAAALLGLAGAFLQGARTILWLTYRPFPSVRADGAPPLTVIIPAYNEGFMVEKSIMSVVDADYPRERLQVIVVDDGSTDDTWSYIERAQRCHPELITAVRFPNNRGKRAALTQGFRRATGEVAITIDSDSIIERSALRAMAGPFCDAKIGAVAGKVIPFNRGSGLLPRMLHVQFTLAFDFLRSAQSAYRTVYCCPGALAAYRLPVVRSLLDRWEEQTFLGIRCTYGEDRALTNFILEEGFDTVYQRDAVVRTVVPETYTKLCRMYLRWNRSQIREGLRFARILWRRPLRPRLIAFVETSISNLRLPLGCALLVPVLSSLHGPSAVMRMVVAVGLVALFNMLYFLRSERSWEFTFGVLYVYFALFALTWIFPYAALTLRRTSWLTR